MASQDYDDDITAKMTPKEFHTYWYTDEQALLVAGEYLNTKSKAERMELLSKWGLTEYKKEVERKIWLDELLWTYIEEELGNPPSPRVLLEEQEQLIKRFKEYLQDLELLREYEIEDLIEAYRGELICQFLFHKVFFPIPKKEAPLELLEVIEVRVKF